MLTKNMIFYLYFSKSPCLYLRALKDINPGDELYINYCEELTPLAEIQEYCKNSYYFDYKLENESECCQKWIEDQNDKLVGRQSYAGDEDPAEKSKKYIQKYSTDMLKRIAKTQKDNNHQRYTLQACGALMQQENLLSDTSILKLRMLRYAADGMLAQHQYKEALPYALRILEGYKQMLPKHSAVLAMYNLKVGTIHWHLQEIQEAIKALADAAHGLEITHGTDHNMYKDCTGKFEN